jgi:hypothetical protein
VDLTFDLLAAREGDSFTLVAAGPDGEIEVPLVLRSARSNPGDHPGGALEFTGPVDVTLTQGTYPLRHDEIGAGPLFLVPVGQTPDARTYEAVFG